MENKPIMKRRLLLVDDSSDYRHSLLALLGLADYIVEEASSAQDAKEKLGRNNYDLVISDLRLSDNNDSSDLSGLEVAKIATNIPIPCIILTGFASVNATRLALRARGSEPLAVDFIEKSAGPQVLSDAISAVLSNSSEAPTSTKSTISIDVDRSRVWNRGKPLDLSKDQYDLLAHLYLNRGAVCSSKELLKVIYGEDVPTEDAIGDRRLENLVDRLREKIEDDPTNPRLLIKVYGRGFKLIPNQ